ncbi:MAG: phosphatase PAP2 family protein [Alphaproteobacteria bacterium]|nr:phosphatase PAP2 family protein [Alphaproteobacteria bacterium]
MIKAPGKQALIAAALVTAAIVLLALFADRPLALMLKDFDQQNPGGLDLFRRLTELGNSKWYLWPTGLAALAGLGFTALMKHNPARQAQIRRIALACAFVFACVAVSGLLVDLLKIIFGRARPILLETEGVFAWAPFTASSRWASFPSGHSNTAFALAFALTMLWPRWRLLFGASAVLVASTRFIITAHFISDVVGGAIVAALTTCLIAAIFASRGWLPRPPP